MTNLDETYINKFKEAYKKDFGEALSDKDAYDLFFRLVRLVSTVLYGAQQYSSELEHINPVDIDESNFIANLKD
ncbi:MAG TPA: hypothetical protein PLX50_00165 [Candidatus Aminicenantes bacterium]|nr:hypothetical protein [Candidatus Aminicenantes bacterium]